jgi:undecaprenyl-diphosphatase
LLILGSIPALILGIGLENIIESSLRTPFIVAFNLIFFGLIMMIADRLSKKIKNFKDLKIKDSILIGLAQAIALMPGVSRSGITMTAGLFRNFKREAVAEFSFLLATPAIAGAGLLSFLKIIKNGNFSDHIAIYILGFLAALISSYLAIAWLLKYVQKHSLSLFAYYRFILAATIIIYFLLK